MINPLMINLALCLIIVLLIKVTPTEEKTREVFVMYATFILLIFFHTFVDITSVPDLDAYYQEFMSVKQYSWQLILSGEASRQERAFLLLMKATQLVGGNFRFFLFVCSLMIITPYYIVAKRYSPYVGLSILIVLLTVYNQSIFVLRQHIAIAISLMSYRYIINRQLLQFLLLFCIATLFHRSAVILLPIYFVYTFNRKVVYGGIVLAAILTYWVDIQKIIINYAIRFGYEIYIDGSDIMTNETGAILSVMILICYVIFLGSKVFEPGIKKLVFYALCISAVLNVIGIGLPMIPRLVLYFSVVSFIAVPITFDHIRHDVLRWGYLICLLGAYYYSTFNGSAYEFLEGYSLGL